MKKNNSLTKYNEFSEKETEFFKKITRLFSGPVANYQRQSPYKPKVKDLYKYNFTDVASKSGGFKRSSNPFKLLLSNKPLSSDVNRLDRYLDYGQMEFDAYVATALDIYANEITNHSVLEPLLTVESTNDHIREIVTDLFYNIINIEFNLRAWVRETCKYGDNYLYIEAKDGEGITSVIQIPQEQIERLEGLDEENPNYVQFQWNAGGVTFENWQICHMRLPGNGKYYPYGTSVLDPCRRVWRQLELMINHMIAYRVIRSGEKKVFYLQVGHVDPKEVEQYVDKTMTTMKKTEIIDPEANTVDKRYSPFGVEEDYVIPIRGDLSSKIDVLSSNSNATAIEDIEFLREIFFAALKIPQTYLARSEGGEDQTSLAQKNITFSNTVGVIQQHIISELTKMGIIHLYSLGFRGKDLLNFKLKLCSSSKLAQTQELQNLKMKVEIAQSVEKVTNRRWVAEKIMGFTGEEYRRMQIERYSDAKFDAMLATIGKNAETGGGDEFGGDLGSIQPPMGDMGGMDDMGGDMGMPDDSASEPESDEKDDVLLAAPGYRMVPKKDLQPGDEYSTPRSKGKTHTKKNVSSSRGDEQSRKAEATGGISYVPRQAGASYSTKNLHESREVEEVDQELKVLEEINETLRKILI